MVEPDTSNPNTRPNNGAPRYFQDLNQNINHHEQETVRLEKLFRKLDVNGDGRIDIEDVTVAMHKLGVPHGHVHAKKFMEKSNVAKSGYIDFSEFINYVVEHEKNLQIVFGSLDENKDGLLDPVELVSAFQKMGIHVDRKEANNLVKRMDRDGTLQINFQEWRDYLLFYPEHDKPNRLSIASQCLDIGEDSLVPDDFTDRELNSGMWWRHLVSGGVAGAVSRTCTAPLDRLKVFLQVHERHHFKNIYSCLTHMIHEGGARSLWRGNGINVLKIAPESAIKFMAYEQVKRLIKGNSSREIEMKERFLAGSLAGGISQSAIYPLEVLKTRLSLRKTGQYRSIVHAAMCIYRTEGLRSFYRGYVPNLLGIIPYAGIDLCIYETLKKMYQRNHPGDRDPGVLVFLTCGTISSTCGQIASYPLALIRTRLQAQSCPGVTALKADATMTGLFRNILQTEGVLGLYRGIAPNFMKVAPAVSISYVVYERCRQALGVTMT